MASIANQTLYMSRGDLARLERLIASVRARDERDLAYLDSLEARLEQAQPVAAREVPPSVVTMNSRVRLYDPATGVRVEYTLVFPESADASQERLSVLAPLGAALLGAREGDRVRWETPAGEREMVLEAILYQPEAAGRYDL
jgi:regulator of nucleoside diphosphate kinase